MNTQSQISNMCMSRSRFDTSNTTRMELRIHNYLYSQPPVFSIHNVR